MTDHRAERLRAAVRSLPMLRGLPEHEKQMLESIAGVVDVPKGQALWEAGDPPDRLTLIVAGRVKVLRRGPTSDVILEIFGPGEPVGAAAVYNRIPYPASAVAMEPTSLLTLPAVEYFALLERHPEIAKSLIGEITRLYVALSHKLEESRQQRVEARVARLFLGLGERLGRPSDEGIVIPMHFSRQEIAEMIGSTVETTIRIMSRWGREGIVLTGQNRFVVPSLDTLRDISEGRYEG